MKIKNAEGKVVCVLDDKFRTVSCSDRKLAMALDTYRVHGMWTMVPGEGHEQSHPVDAIEYVKLGPHSIGMLYTKLDEMGYTISKG
jgi:hypothetical protein